MKICIKSDSIKEAERLYPNIKRLDKEYITSYGSALYIEHKEFKIMIHYDATTKVSRTVYLGTHEEIMRKDFQIYIQSIKWFCSSQKDSDIWTLSLSTACFTRPW